MKAKSHAWVTEVTYYDGDIRWKAGYYSGYTQFLSQANLKGTREEARKRARHIRKYYIGKGSSVKSVRVRKVVLV